MTRLAVAIIALAIGAWLTFLNPMNTPPDLSAAVDKTEPELITDLPEPGPLGSPPPPVVTGNIEYVQPKLPSGQVLTGELDRMAYDSTTDSIWMAEVLEPSRRKIHQYSIPNESVTTYEVPGNDTSGNRWSGGIRVGSDGTVWLAFSSTVARKRPGDSEFQQLHLPKVPVRDGDLVPGIWGATLMNDLLWVSRAGVKHLTVFDSDSARSFRLHVPVPDDDSYPLYFEPISDDRLFMTYGSAGGTMNYEQSAVVDLIRFSKLMSVKETILPFFVPAGNGRIAAITPSGDSNLMLFDLAGDQALSISDPFPKSTPFPQLKIRAEEGFRSGGLASDPQKEVVWFFVLDDRTPPDVLESRSAIPDPDRLSAYFVRSSLDGRLTERYLIHLTRDQGGLLNQMFSMYGRFGSTTKTKQEAMAEAAQSIEGSPDKAIIPKFYPMVVDKRGDLWAKQDGHPGGFVRISATDRR